MTKDEIKDALESINRLDGWLSELKGMIEAPQELLLINRPSILADINCAIKDMRTHGASIRSAIQSTLDKAETVEIPEGFRMSPEQNIVWDWAAAHGLTLVADECNDLLWRLEKIQKFETVDLDAMRDHFEKWMTANGDYPHLIHKHFGGNYLREETSMKWDGFKQGVKYAQR